MGLPDLPMMRQYLLPEDGHVWLKRDYSSQEVRALAHFEDGALMEQYRKNPNLDPHQFAAELITDLTGNSLSRSDTKRIAFSILYGSGIAALAADLGVSNYEAKQFKELYLAAFPGVRDLSSDIKLRGRQNLPVRTIGGRLIYAERGANGRDFSYKLLNHLIQGSAADITKQGLINHYNAGGAQLLALVHDEINVTCPIGRWGVESEKLRMAMADINIDVPLTSDMYVGRNWEDADQNKNVTELAA
jgi:DNA polymerase-1